MRDHTSNPSYAFLFKRPSIVSAHAILIMLYRERRVHLRLSGCEAVAVHWRHCSCPLIPNVKVTAEGNRLHPRCSDCIKFLGGVQGGRVQTACSVPVAPAICEAVLGLLQPHLQMVVHGLIRADALISERQRL